MFYNYCYVDPSKPGKYTYPNINVCFLFEPFYVGKGTKNRLYSHLSSYHLNESTVNPIKSNKIRKLLKRYTLRSYVFKIYESVTEEDVLSYERTLISSIGRKDIKTGPLTNADDGGTGSCGRKDSPDTINNRKTSLKPVWEARRGSTYEDLYGTERALEIKDKIKNSMCNSHLTKRSEKFKRRLSETRRGSQNPMARTYVLVDPDGTQFLVDSGLRRFCKEQCLLFSTIWNNINKGAIKANPKARNIKNKEWYLNSIGWSVTRL